MGQANYGEQRSIASFSRGRGCFERKFTGGKWELPVVAASPCLAAGKGSLLWPRREGSSFLPAGLCRSDRTALTQAVGGHPARMSNLGICCFCDVPSSKTAFPYLFSPSTGYTVAQINTMGLLFLLFWETLLVQSVLPKETQSMKPFTLLYLSSFDSLSPQTWIGWIDINMKFGIHTWTVTCTQCNSDYTFFTYKKFVLRMAI